MEKICKLSVQTENLQKENNFLCETNTLYSNHISVIAFRLPSNGNFGREKKVIKLVTMDTVSSYSGRRRVRMRWESSARANE